MDFNQLLKNYRADKDIKQDDLADLLGIGHSTYSQIEQGNLSSKIGGSLLRAMAPYFQAVNNLDLLLGLLGEFGIDIEKMKRDIDEAEWVYLPKLPKEKIRVRFITRNTESRTSVDTVGRYLEWQCAWETKIMGDGLGYIGTDEIICWQYISSPPIFALNQRGKNDT